MIKKTRRCQEVVTGNGNTYLFSGTLGNIESLSFLSGDPSALFARLTKGELPPVDIKNVISTTMDSVNKINCEDLDLTEETAKFIEDFGLQDSAVLCRMLLSHALIGDVKKKSIESKQAMTGMIRKFRLFPSMTSKRLGLFLAGIFTIFAISACMIFK